MKYVCFGYLDTKRWAAIPPAEQNAMMDRCFAYDDVLRKNGQRVHGEGLQGPESTVTLRPQGGKAVVTDGPYAETKELLGGLLIIEARDLNHAVQLISNHPGMQMGPWEIRPAVDMTPIIKESQDRRNSQR